MLNKIHQLATPRNLLIIWLSYFVMAGGVMSMMAKKMEAVVGGNVGPIDLVIPTYSIQTAYKMVAAYGETGRALYRTIELTVDVAYPLIYGLAFALLIAFLWQRVAPLNYWAKRLPLVAFAAVLFDFLENITIVILLSTYPLQLDSVAFAASLFSLMKWSLFFINITCILVGFVMYLLKRKKSVAKQDMLLSFGNSDN